MQLSGTLLDITRSAGDFVDPANGNKVVYDFTLLHVLAGHEVLKVRLPREVNSLDLPFGKGDIVHLEVTVPASVKIMYAGVQTPAQVPVVSTVKAASS